MTMPLTTIVLYPADLAKLPDGTALFGYAHADTAQILVLGGKDQQALQPRAAELGWLGTCCA